MCDRYFVILPPKKYSDRDLTPVWHKHLTTLRTSEVKLHKSVFTKQLWSKPTDKRYSWKEKDNNLKQNVIYMAEQTNNFGLLLTQCHWFDLLTLQQGNIIMQEEDDLSQGIAMYRMLLRKDPIEFDKFINALHMTSNPLIANQIEAHIECEKRYQNECERREQAAKRQAARYLKTNDRTQNCFESEKDITRSSKQKRTSRNEIGQFRSTNCVGALQYRDGNTMLLRDHQFPSNAASSSASHENDETVSPRNRNRLSRFLSIFR